MSQRLVTYITPEEYLKRERAAEYKSEYLNGEIFAMSGAGRAHNLITTNISTEISQQLKRRPYETYAGGMRVKVASIGFYTYPDVVVVCDEPKFEDSELETLLNPTVLVEVLSQSRALRSYGQDFLLSNAGFTHGTSAGSTTQSSRGAVY